MFRNLPALGILRSALWEGEKGNRLVNYNSSQLKVPSSFHFNGRIIFAVNTLPTRNNAFAAVLSRVDQYELDASNEEVLDLMRQLAVQGYEGMTPDECLEVVDYHRRVLGDQGTEPAPAGAILSQGNLLTASGHGLEAACRIAAPRDRQDCRSKGF